MVCYNRTVPGKEHDMSTQPHHYHVTRDSDLQQILRKAAANRQPVILEDEGVRYRVVREVPEINLTEDPFATYDVAKVRAALKASAGAFRSLDTAAFKQDIWEARDQDTPGRPA